MSFNKLHSTLFRLLTSHKFQDKLYDLTRNEFHNNTHLIPLISSIAKTLNIIPVLEVRATEKSWFHVQTEYILRYYKGQKKTPDQKAEEIRRNHWRDYWMCEIGTGQKVAHLHDSYMMIIMMAVVVVVVVMMLSTLCPLFLLINFVIPLIPHSLSQITKHRATYVYSIQ
jgi:hypothetical protein